MGKTKSSAATSAPPPAHEIRRIAIDELVEDPENARTHDRRNVRAIKASLHQFGQVLPLVVEKGTRRVLGGNATLRAMRSLGWADASIVEVDEHEGRASALAIALNRSAELAEWNDERLSAALRHQALDFDLNALGWEEAELRRMLMPKLEMPGDDEDDDLGDVAQGEKFALMVSCEDENEQADLLVELRDRGLKVKVMMG